MRKNFVSYGDSEAILSEIKAKYLSKGEVPYTASKVETGYIEDTFSANGSGSANITFSSPMPDTDYLVVTDCNRVGVEIGIINKTVNGFTLVVANNNVSELLIRVDYTAFELFELTTIADIESDISTRLKIVFDMSDIESPAENQTVLYMGETTTTEPIYKQGGIYEYDGTVWQLKSADNITLDDALDTTSNNAVKNSVIATEVNKRLTVTDTMPTASADLLGQTRLYIGSTTTNYQEGGIYKCESDGQTPPTYAWNIKNKADIDISDKQDKTLETPLTIGGASRTTVEGALGGLNEVVSKTEKTLSIGGSASAIVKIDVSVPFIAASYGKFTEIDFQVRSDNIRFFISANDGAYLVTAQHNYRSAGWLTGLYYLVNDSKSISLYVGILNYPADVGAKLVFNGLDGAEITEISKVDALPSGYLSMKQFPVIYTSDLTSSITSGSNAPITSGGVYDALNNKTSVTATPVDSYVHIAGYTIYYYPQTKRMLFNKCHIIYMQGPTMPAERPLCTITIPDGITIPENTIMIPAILSVPATGEKIPSAVILYPDGTIMTTNSEKNYQCISIYGANVFFE